MSRKRVRMLLAAAAALAVAGGLAWNAARPPVRVWWFPDQSMLALEGVTYGRQHRMLHGTWWQKPLLVLLPGSLRTNFQRRFGCMIADYTSARPDTLVLWLHRRGSAAGPGHGWAYRTTRAVLFDEQGREFETGGRGYAIWLPDSPGNVLGAVEVPVFPRRGNMIGVRLYRQVSHGQWVRVASCKLPNPASGPFPTWTPQPLPITKQAADLTVRLTELAAAVPRAEVPRGGQSREAAWSRAAFRLTGPNGQPAPWEPVGLEVTDATGNFWTPRAAFAARQSEAQQLYFIGTPWTEETAWDLRVEFARTAGFAPADLWTVRRVLVPSLGRHHPNGQSTTKRGVTVQVFGLWVPPKDVPAAGWQKGVPRVQLLTSRPLDGLRLTLVRATTGRGEPIPCSDIVQTHSDREYGANLRVPPGTRSVDLTFALHRTRTVTFRAKPPPHGPGASRSTRR